MPSFSTGADGTSAAHIAHGRHLPDHRDQGVPCHVVITELDLDVCSSKHTVPAAQRSYGDDHLTDVSSLPSQA